MNKEDFKAYLADAEDLSDGTISGYIGQLDRTDSVINNLLRDKNIVKHNIFEIEDRETFEKAKNVLSGDRSFLELNRRAHNNYTAPLNHLCNFAESFFEIPSENTSNPSDILTTSPSISDSASVVSFSRNRIFFGAPGTGKSYLLNKDKDELIKNGGGYERVTFHPDYSYANFVGCYKPVSISESTDSSFGTDHVISVLSDCNKTAQQKYDELFTYFKNEGDLTRLPLLIGLYTDDEIFHTYKADGSPTANDNDVERNHGRSIRKYVNLYHSGDSRGRISYEYVPGPFMRIYVKAIKSLRTESPKPYLLLIEEINRANVAAVFGDMFQLLDRDGSDYSQYSIETSEDIKKYLAKELGGLPEEYSEIRIPDNMYIWASMNSADQGVFPMDTAFKRRWNFIYIGIDTCDEDIRDKYVQLTEANQVIEWNSLRKAINDYLADQNINEDKQLGPYFISREIVVPEKGNLIDTKDFVAAFKDKVIMYLFDDAAKQKRESLFAGCEGKVRRRYSAICDAFDNVGVNIFNKEIVANTNVRQIVE